jgi:MFS family permease
VVGGLSEGNVQLAIAIISDVSTPANRSKSLAFVGLAFAICFTTGPPIGAYFASQPLPAAFESFGVEFNVYAVPALLTLGLLILETIFLYAFLPETRGTKAKASSEKADGKETSKTPALSVNERLSTLKHLRRLHFFFLCIFSGVEFTLTVLTFDRAYFCLTCTSQSNSSVLQC